MACTEGNVRLLGGLHKLSGVLTVCVNGDFATFLTRTLGYSLSLSLSLSLTLSLAGLILQLHKDTYTDDIYRTDIYLLLVVFYAMELSHNVVVIVLYNLQLYLAVPVVVETGIFI